MRKIFCTLFALLFTSSIAFGVELPSVMNHSMASEYGMPSLFQMIFSMVFVIGLIYFTGWVYQKLNIVGKKQVSKMNKKSDVPRFTVLQTMSLGHQRHIYTIEMDGKILLVGSTPTQINLIKEFEKACDVDMSDITVVKNDLSQADNGSSMSQKSVDIDELYKKYKN